MRGPGAQPAAVGGEGGKAPNNFSLAKWINSWTFFFFQNFKSVHIYMKDAEFAETNDKSIFRFLILEIWWFLYSKLFSFLFRWIFSTKSTITQKINIGKIGKLNFQLFQDTTHLACKYDHFWTIFFVNNFMVKVKTIENWEQNRL